MIPILLAAAFAAAQPAAVAPTLTPVTLSTASGLRWQTLVAGSGAMPTEADSVVVTYEGRLADGTVFDATSEPVTLPVAALVPGFTEGLLLMRKGGRYKLWIPPQLAYGSEGAGGVIPPDAVLEFTVALLDIVPPQGPAPQ
jgi:FKBP-type peptidyl-prolyl cis-trans isomerase